MISNLTKEDKNFDRDSRVAYIINKANYIADLIFLINKNYKDNNEYTFEMINNFSDDNLIYNEEEIKELKRLIDTTLLRKYNLLVNYKNDKTKLHIRKKDF